MIKDVDAAVELQHKYRGIDLLSFILEPGDTLLFTYKDKSPIVTVKNRTARPYDYTYEQIRYDSIIGNSLSAWSIYKVPPLFLKPDGENLSDYIQNNYKRAAAETNSEMSFLSSNKSKFSPNVLSFYTNRSIYRDKMLKLEDRESISFNEIEQKDELLKYSYYREFIDLIMSKQIHGQGQAGTKRERPTKIYDDIRENKSLTPKTKEYLLFKYMQEIVENCSNEEIQSYWDLFKKDYSTSTAKVDYLERQYNLQDSLSDQLVLRDLHGQKTTLENLLKKHNDKIIYIDFWASWCGPCRTMMPESKKLHEEFNNGKVLFIYLALWDKEKEWKAACEEENLYENSYRIENSKSSTFITKMGMNRIPHYMLYGKEGQLYQQNAPHPNTKEIRRLLKDLTK